MIRDNYPTESDEEKASLAGLLSEGATDLDALLVQNYNEPVEF